MAIPGKTSFVDEPKGELWISIVVSVWIDDVIGTREKQIF